MTYDRDERRGKQHADALATTGAAGGQLLPGRRTLSEGLDAQRAPAAGPGRAVQKAKQEAPPTGAAAAERSPEALARRAQMLVALPMVTQRWKTVGKALFTEDDHPTAPCSPEAFTGIAYHLIVTDDRDLEPVQLALAGPGRERYAQAVDRAARAVRSDRPVLDKIKADIDYLASAGDLTLAATRLVAGHAMTSALAKDALETLGELGTTALSRYVDGQATAHGVALRRSQADADGIAPHIATFLSAAGGVERKLGCASLLRTLRAGAPKVPPPVAEAPKDSPAIQAEANALATAIRTVATIANGRGPVAPIVLSQLDHALGRATPRARELVWADQAVMGLIARALDPKQAHALIDKLDTVEELYQQVKPAQPPMHMMNVPDVVRPKLPTGNPAFPRLCGWLEARAGEAHRVLRLRVLAHTKLKSTVIDRLPRDEQTLVYRLVARGTTQAGPEDRVHAAAEDGRGAAVVRALRDLAATDRKRLAELERDPVFRRSVESMTMLVDVDGVMLRPWDICQALWGRAPGAGNDPGITERNATGNDHPLIADERMKLDRELFDPTLADLHAQIEGQAPAHSQLPGYSLQSIYQPRAQAILDRLRSFERLAAGATYKALLQRDHVVAGVELAQRFGHRYGVDLRTWIYEHAGPNVRSGVGRILGTEHGAAVGRFAGEAIAIGQAKPGKISLAQALRETTCGTVTVSEMCSIDSRELARAMADGSKPRVLEIWARFERGIGLVARDLEEQTGIRIRAIDLMRNAYLEHAGQLEAQIAERFDASADRAEIMDRLGIAAAGHAPTSAPGDLAAQRFGTPAQFLWKALGALTADSSIYEYQAAGSLLALAWRLPHLDGSIGERNEAPVEETPPKSFAGYYRRHHGASPDGHAEAVLRAMTGPRVVALDDAARALGLDPARIARPAATGAEELVVDGRNQHLVRAAFTTDTARHRARQIWEVLHASGRLETINTQLYGDCNDEEQRLIRIAFRRLSGGLDVAFYLRQAIDARARRAGDAGEQVARTVQVVTGGDGASLDDQHVAVGAMGSISGMGTTALAGGINVHGTATELDRALAVATTGEIDLRTRLTTAAARGDSDQVFRILEAAEPAERRAVLDDGALTNQLQRLGQWQWERCFKVLTGQADLADRLYSRSHGDGSFLERNLGGTHEAGMKEDVQAHVRKLRLKLDREVRAEVARMANKPDARQIDHEIHRRVLDACGYAAASPAVQAIMRGELETGELREMDAMLVNGGTAPEWEVAAGGNAKAILAEIRGLSADERRARLVDPQYLQLLGERLPDQADHRDAINALSATDGADVKHGGGALARLDEGSRDSTQVRGADRDARKTLRALSELSPDEYRRLQADPRLQVQVMESLSPDERGLARELLASSSVNSDTDLYVHQAIGRLRVACLRGWRDVLVQAVEIYKLDFARGFVAHGTGGHQPAPEAAPKIDAFALRAQIWHGAAPVIRAFADEHVRNPGKKTKDAITADQMIDVVRLAVIAKSDPSDALIAENILTADEKRSGPPPGLTDSIALPIASVDAAGLADALRAASDSHVIERWTSVKIAPAGGAPADTMAKRYEELVTAERAAKAASRRDADSHDDVAIIRNVQAASPRRRPADSEESDLTDEAATPTTTAHEVTPAVDDPVTHATGRREDDPVLRAADVARRRFVEYSIRVAQALEELLLPYMGDDRRSSTAPAGEKIEGRDNKRYNDLAQIIYERIPRLPPAAIGKAIGVRDEHQGLLEGDTRRHVGEVTARDERHLRHRGEQTRNTSIAQDDKEVLDEEQTLLGREYALAITPGAITADKSSRLDQHYEAVDRAQEAHQTALETAAGWASLIVGTVVTIAATVLTGGLATGPVSMLALAGATAALSATAKSLVMEKVLDGEWDREDAARMIAQEVTTGIVTAGTTYYAQRLLTAAGSATALAKQAAGVRAVLRTPPKLFQQIAHGAAEEVTSEIMSTVVDAGLAATDPAHWMHGYQEGAHEAKQAALATIAQAKDRALQAGVSTVLVSLGGHIRSRSKLRGPHGAHPPHTAGLDGHVPKKPVDVLRNLKETLGDPGDKLLEALVQWGLQQNGPINWAAAPADLLRGWIEEVGESGIEKHTGTVHQHRRQTLAQADLHRAADKLTAHEKRDFLAMQDSAHDTDPYVSVDAYTRAREHVILKGLSAMLTRNGVTLTDAQTRAFVEWARRADSPEQLAERAASDPRKLPDVMAAGTAKPGDAVKPTSTVSPATPGHFEPTHEQGAPESEPSRSNEIAPETDGHAFRTTAAAVAGSTFRSGARASAPDAIKAQAHSVMAAAVTHVPAIKSIEKIKSDHLGGAEKAQADDTYLVTLAKGDDIDVVTVRVTSGAIGGDDVAATVVNNTKRGASFVERGGAEVKLAVEGRYVIQLADSIDPIHTERALAHELTEIVAQRALYHRGKVADPSVLNARTLAADAELSPHDRGRVTEINVLARQAKLGDANADLELLALIDHLGLRPDAADGARRRELVTPYLTGEGRDALDRVGKPTAQLDDVTRRQLDGVRAAAADDHRRAAERAASEPKVDHERPAASKDGKLIAADKDQILARAKALADEARVARANRAVVTAQDLRQKIKTVPAGELYELDIEVQIGGGAALAARNKTALLIDDRGRWQSDKSTHIAQTASQLAGLIGAGVGNPFEFAGPNERVPMDAVRFWEDSIAAQGPVINGTAAIRIDEQGRMLLDIDPKDGGPVITVKLKHTPMVATGFPPERIPGTPRGMSPRDAIDHVRSVLTRMAATGSADDRARAVSALTEIRKLPLEGAREQHLAAARKILVDHHLDGTIEGTAAKMIEAGDRWHELSKAQTSNNQKKAFLGDHANLESIDASISDHWVIGGVSGTGISAAEIILANNPNAHVYMVGDRPPPGLLENNQFQEVLARHADDKTVAAISARKGPDLAAGDGRLHVIFDQKIDAAPTIDAAGNIHVKDGVPPDYEEAVANGAHNPFVGGAYVGAIGREGQLPRLLATLADDVVSKGGVVKVELKFQDGHYTHYELRLTPVGGATQTIDVTGAASRSPPWHLIEKIPDPRFPTDRSKDITTGEADFWRASDMDAPPESGNFDAGFVASAIQAARYAIAKIKKGHSDHS